MPKRFKTLKQDKDDFLSKNHNHAIKFRKRVQEDFEKEQELKEYLKDAETTIQDPIRRNHFPE